MAIKATLHPADFRLGFGTVKGENTDNFIFPGAKNVRGHMFVFWDDYTLLKDAEKFKKDSNWKVEGREDKTGKKVYRELEVLEFSRIVDNKPKTAYGVYYRYTTWKPKG
jgi:hypothetical protein